MRIAPFTTFFLLTAGSALAQSQPPIDADAFRNWAETASHAVIATGCNSEADIDGDPCWIQNHWLRQLSADEVEKYINNGPVSMDNLFRHVEGFLQRGS